ncbi:MAG: type II secretion system protein GspM [Casimicrobiaceae bacterium]
MRDRHSYAIPPALRDYWERAALRERVLVAFGFAIVAAVVTWTFIWQPLLRDTERAQRDLRRDRAILASARVQADEIAGLAKSPATLKSSDPRSAVERVLTERQLRAAVTALDVQDNRVRVTFAAIHFDALVGALDVLAKTEGLRLVEATLTPRVAPGTVRAELALAR